MSTRDFRNLEAAQVSGEHVAFSFGKNWANFLGSLTDDKIAWAESSLRQFFGLDSLQGHTFLDIGCGSGLFSLAAHRLGADRVISFDADPFSVQCAEYLREQRGAPSNWLVKQGSILNASDVAELPQASIVYSWGVLHHTGSMWKAINNTAGLVAPGGLFFIAIYNKHKRSEQWLRIKRLYNRSPRPVRFAMEAGYGLWDIGVQTKKGRNPIRHVRDYGKRARGMSWWYDVRDWLGGLPYEYASTGEIIEALQQHGFELVKQDPSGSYGCNEFLFRKAGGA
jgi:2-polyprenyl-6-hydroxyphenyl methylase/3-demethylubiquinone-9 3-methyltransferase